MKDFLGAFAPYIALLVAVVGATRSYLSGKKKEELESDVSRAKAITEREHGYLTTLESDIKGLREQVQLLTTSYADVKEENFKLAAKFESLKEDHAELQAKYRETLIRLDEQSSLNERSVTRIKKLEAQVVDLGGQPWTDA